MGWYQQNDDTEEDINVSDADRMSEKLSYSFTLVADISLIALYQSNGRIVLHVSGTANTYCVDDVEQTEDTVEISKLAGSSVTVEYTGNGTFCYWKNASGKIISRDKSYTFTMIHETSLVAVAVEQTSTGGEGSDSEVTYMALVEFVSYYGQVMQAETWNSTDTTQEVSFPTGPSKAGGIFQYWSLDGEKVSVSDVIAKIDGNTSRITLKPVYKANETTCTVTVYYDYGNNAGAGADAEHAYADKSVYENKTSGTSMTVHTIQVEGKKFSHWSSDADGTTILGTGDSYYFNISKNMTLYAIYVSEEDTVTKKPVIQNTDMYAFVEDGCNKIGFVFTRDITDEYEVLENGALYGINEELFGGETAKDNLVIGGTKLNQLAGVSTNTSGIFILTVNVETQTTTTVYARGYVVLKNKKTGNIETLYSDIVSASHSELSK